MNILALDLGVKTGWAFGDSEHQHRLHSGVQDFNVKRGESSGMRFLYFDKWICKMITEFKPAVVAYEMPFVRGHALMFLNGLLGILFKACSEAGIEYFPVNPSALKKFVMGTGKASKAMMIHAAQEKYHRLVVDDNEADALHVWGWGQVNLKRGSDDD